MTPPIPDPRLRAPRARPVLVPRPRLHERLDDALHARLTLVSAPAGFGKTTLVGAWAAASGLPTAWLSLDADDNDPARFLAGLVAALDGALDGALGGALGGATAPGNAGRRGDAPPTVEVLAGRLADVGRLSRPLVLVLDGYQAVHRPAVHRLLGFVVEHAPPPLHLVLATREDPPLPLARLRAAAELHELRAPELRFTRPEAAAFVRDVMGVDLSDEDLDVLEARTEGWAAGLQLAALSLRDRPAGRDRSAFVRAFAGNDRFVRAYLADEVLARLPGPDRQFLLRAAVLDRLSGPLCDAVTGRTGSRARLAALERRNVFLVALDGAGDEYRFHPLFSSALRERLLTEQPARLPLLHGRASVWHERHGRPADAIGHALAARDFGRAADLVERAVPALRRDLREEAVLGWLDALPEEVVRARPGLAVHHAKARLRARDLGGVEDRLEEAERALAVPDGGAADEDGSRRRRLPAEIAVYRAAAAMARGAPDEARRHAEGALALAREEDHLARGAAGGFLALAALHAGDLEAARGRWADAELRLLRAGHLPDALGAVRAQADILVVQGRPREARRAYERGLRHADAARATPRGAADLHVGLAELHLGWNDLASAREHLRRGEALGPAAGLAAHGWRARAAEAGVRAAAGEVDAAIDLLDEARRRRAPDFFPDARPIAAARARLLLARGRLSEARAWAREAGVGARDDATYVREYELVTLARVLLARGAGAGEDAGRALADAVGLLTRLEEAAREGGRIGSLIEILVLRALAHEARGEPADALAPLGRALEHAEPEGHARVFLDEGAAMAALLGRAARRGVAPGFTRDLLDALRSAAPSPAVSPGGETLSVRELDVLGWLATDLGGPDIARELGVSLHTLRTHTKRVYEKLGVHDRRRAVRRARALGLL